MPRQPQWYQRVPEALGALERFPAPVLDRSALEELLGIGRRDAIRLMHRLGGYQCGRTFLVEREMLRRMLSAVARGEAWQWEARRRRRVAENLEETKREWNARRVTIPVAAAGTAGVEELPATVRLRPGCLEVDFDGAVDLLSQLLQLTRTISSDYPRFQELLGE